MIDKKKLGLDDEQAAAFMEFRKEYSEAEAIAKELFNVELHESEILGVIDRVYCLEAPKDRKRAVEDLKRSATLATMVNDLPPVPELTFNIFDRLFGDGTVQSRLDALESLVE